MGSYDIRTGLMFQGFPGLYTNNSWAVITSELCLCFKGSLACTQIIHGQLLHQNWAYVSRVPWLVHK